MATPERSYEDLIEALKAWAQYNDPHVKAAVGLLIDRGAFRRPDLVEACVTWPGRAGPATVDWAALSWLASCERPGGERTILAAAVLLGEDGAEVWSNWQGLGLEDRQALVRAFAEALDTDPASIA